MDMSFVVSNLVLLLKGAGMTVQLTIYGIVIGTAIGFLVALGKISGISYIKWFCSLYTWLIRGTPLMMQLFVIYYGLPQVGITLDPMPAAVIGLSVNSGAYLAEIIRAGIESIPKGQMEAARALGMSYGQAMRRVIVPQAYRRLIPPMGNEFIALLKDSSLVSTIAMVDLMRVAQQRYSVTLRPLEIFGMACVLYLLMTTMFTILFGRLEKRLSVYE
ncbi:amino acid ABC transporter permease [Calorimonas adulescens]|uniref:Amino acid ABC transporter permease n=1 Tax=Calorimonas adulescens TaxID=2606906 RepID=A0A5D8QCN2_9THEO|nr:amino acid ABC transporter permease [Calorimonas adulescens]TZE81556.1 amino acid ABC transporter permease [Calorimonas adulescens]